MMLNIMAFTFYYAKKKKLLKKYGPKAESCKSVGVCGLALTCSQAFITSRISSRISLGQGLFWYVHSCAQSNNAREECIGPDRL